MSQECRTCAAEAPDEDQFCEQCGARLADGGGNDGTLCVKCGAGEDDIDAEGFCLGCGFRRIERGRDHLEIEISSALAGVTDRGLRHYRNEDYLALKRFEPEGIDVLIVCDGVSSVRDPDIASASAAERLLLSLEEAIALNGHVTPEDLEVAIRCAQGSVASIRTATGATDGNSPATTIVVAAVRNGEISIGWLGDSRAYWVDGGEIRQLTTDHSWLQETLQAGEMPEAEAREHAQAHAITRWLGADAPDEGKPDLLRFEIPGPGKLILCTDGLWNYAPSASDLRAVLDTLESEALPVAHGLVEFARSKGGNDNITAAVLSVAPQPHDSIQG